MTNSIAIVMGLVILALIGVDLLVFDSGALIFLAKKFSALIEWIAFWR